VGRSRVEYATDQITVYPRCPYSCRYCFWRVPVMASRLLRIRPKPLVEARRYLRSRRRRTIVVSFTTDPYPPQEAELKLTRKTLEILSRARKHKVLILTKNPPLALRDLDLMLAHGDMWLGTTVIVLDIESPLEPLAPPPYARLRALKEAHNRGVKTWLSIEPIMPDLTDVQAIVEETLDYVDMYVFGALNYARQLGLREPRPHDYEPVLPVLTLLSDLGKPFVVKKELRRHLVKLGGRPLL